LAPHFDSVDAVRAALLAGEDAQAGAERISQFDAEAVTLQERARAAATALSSLAMYDISADDAAIAAQQARDAERALQARVTVVEERWRQRQDVIAQRDKLDREVGSLGADRDRVARALAVCSGEGGGVPLESWVLRAYLDEVVTMANVRLSTMSAGRYELIVHDAVRGAGRGRGLDLDVIDLHTGQARSVTSLSGGETFLASLALSFGLADVVRQSAGGVHIDALFIDEGFGSLDPAALDDAIDQLHRLGGAGRMVAIISHVEQLKQALPVGIEVSGASGGPSHLRQLAH
jgi:DNA repair protein SbcC/Rad50